MTYVPGKGKVTASVGGVYDDQTNLLAFLWNQDVSVPDFQTFFLLLVFVLCFKSAVFTHTVSHLAKFIGLCRSK